MLQENQHTEFKLLWKEEVLKQVSAFANAEGGVIYVGVADDGKIIGVENVQKLLETLPNAINNKTGIIPNISIEKQEEKDIIKINVKPSSVAISYNGKYYLRSGSVCLELEGKDLSDFLLKKSGITWDSLTTYPKWEFEPDKEAFELFKRLSYDRLPYAKDEKDVFSLIKKLNLLTPDLQPTNAAILLFDKNPQRFFSQAIVKIGRFVGDANIISTDIVAGNLFYQAENVLEILKTKYLANQIYYEGIHRREKFPYPLSALREAILNAIIHRNYNTTSAVLIKVYDNKLSIMNEGKFPPEVKIEDLKREHLSMPHNKLIADVFYKAGFIESWGRGTVQMAQDCIAVGIPAPEYTEDNRVVQILFACDSEENEELNTENVIEKTTEKDSKNITENITENLSKSQKIILKEIKLNQYITSEELANIVGIDAVNIRVNISKLKAKGIIERIGADKGGYWKIKNKE
jgi:ATP-dependent DNA helicase RecG